MKKRFFLWALLTIIMVLFCGVFSANAEGNTAKELTSSCNVSYGNEKTVISCGEKINGIYIEWKNLPGEWQGSDENGSFKGGADRFFHEFVNCSGNEITVNLNNFQNKVSLLRVFGEGQIPSDVQVWEKPCEEADIMLLSTHSDDEHLFFAGILPYYAGELGLDVQVVYMVDHSLNSAERPHELLNGLWNVGVRNYPVIGKAPDIYSESLSAGYAGFKNEGYNEEHFVKYVTENIRRFKPLVVIGHDVKGEYGHGAHMVYTDALIKALPLCNDPSYDNTSADKYGLWDVPKVYLHLYGENEIVMDWDNKILDKFGGRTAFQVSIEEGFSQHKSQHWTWFSKWCGYNKDNPWNVNSAADIEKLSSANSGVLSKGNYSPRRFGLYKTLVGEDVNKNDFLENINERELRGEEPEPTVTPVPNETPVATEAPAVTPSATDNVATENATANATAAPSGSDDNGENKEKKGIDPTMINVFMIALYLVAVAFLGYIVWMLRKRKKK